MLNLDGMIISALLVLMTHVCKDELRMNILRTFQTRYIYWTVWGLLYMIKSRCLFDKKSVLIPTQEIVLVSVVLNSVSMTMRLPDDKKENFSKLCRDALRRSHMRIFQVNWEMCSYRTSRRLCPVKVQTIGENKR